MEIEIARNDLVGVGLFLGYFAATGLPAVLLMAYFKPSFEVGRKMLHFIVVLSIFPLLTLFQTWYMAVLAASMLVLLAYPVLWLGERTLLYRRLAPERKDGEFKTSLLIVQVSIATLITVCWGWLGMEWQYVAVVAVMAWGFGDAAAALVGKRFGRRQIQHRRIEGTKTIEGTAAMCVVGGLAIFGTLVMYAGQPWHVSLAAAALVAPVCAVVELFSNRGMDTITVPFSAALTIVPLMYVFSRVNV